MHQRKAATITRGSAISTLMRLGYVLDLADAFLVNGIPHRLVIEEDEVLVQVGDVKHSWAVFVRTLRPQC